MIASNLAATGLATHEQHLVGAQCLRQLSGVLQCGQALALLLQCAVAAVALLLLKSCQHF